MAYCKLGAHPSLCLEPPLNKHINFGEAWKYGDTEIYVRTNRQTNTLVTILRFDSGAQ